MRSRIIAPSMNMRGWTIDHRSYDTKNMGICAQNRRKTHLLRLSCPLLDPLLCLVPCLVESEQTGLSTTLDELVRLSDELGVEHPAGELGIGGDRVRLGVPGDLGDFYGGVLEFGLDLGMGSDGGCALEPVGEEQLGVVLADG